MTAIKMPDDMQIGSPTLRVRDLEGELSFYEENLGLEVIRKLRNTADESFEVVDLGFRGRFGEENEPLLKLKHDPDANETPHNFSGLYHFAILVPDRRSLASAYSALEKSGVRFEGFADHLVSESLYLHDPERNGIEIYRDRPRNEWPRDAEGHVLMDTLSLNLNSLLDELPKGEGGTSLPWGARIGHMHLRVTDLSRSMRYYSEKLGLDITVDLSAFGAGFLSAGGYHHHIGMNTWHSLGGKPRSRGEAGLETFTLTTHAGSFLDAIAKQLEKSLKSRDNRSLTIIDPDGIEIRVQIALSW